MCLTNKILIGLIVIAIGACFYFSAISLKTHSYWRSEGNKQVQQLETLQQEIHLYEFGEGVPDKDGYQRSLFEQEKYLRALQDLRGIVFRDCDVRSTFTANRMFNVYLPGVTEAQLPVNTPMFAFRPVKNSPDKMEYLGRFTVRAFGVDADTAQPFVSIEPTRQAYEKNERMTQVLSDSMVGQWTLYLSMPIDKAEHGSSNEDYIPFSVQIQYYAEQEYILQDFIARQKKQIDYMTEIVGKGAEIGQPAMEPVVKTLSAENKNRLSKLYDSYEAENEAMRKANDVLAGQVAELERQKAAYQDSINQSVQPTVRQK